MSLAILLACWKGGSPKMFVSACRRYVAVRSPIGYHKYLWWFVTADLTETIIEAADVPRQIRRIAYKRMVIRNA
jgi:hypothetical protein